MVCRIAPLPGAGIGTKRPVASFDPRRGRSEYRGQVESPQSFATLYLAESEQVASRELGRLARRNGRSVDDFIPRDLLTYEVELVDVLDLKREGRLA